MDSKNNSKCKVLMPKGTALWLKKNTKLAPRQIMNFCSINMLIFSALNIQTLAPVDPIVTGQLSKEEIIRCEKDTMLNLKCSLNLHKLKLRTRSKYISKYHKLKRISVIAWFLKKSDNFNRKKVTQLLCTNSGYLNRIIEKIAIEPKLSEEAINPVKIGLCTVEEVNEIIKNTT